MKTTNEIILERFCTWQISRRFFSPLFQLIPIIGFLAPPLSKSHMVFMVSNSTTRTWKYWCARNWRIWHVHNEEARRASIHEYTVVVLRD